MHIIGGSLSLVSVFCTYSIEMISSEPTTLEELFPGYNGVMPLVKQLFYDGQLPNFGTFRNKTLKYESALLLRIDHIIFGWIRGGNYISEPRSLFPDSNLWVIAFDMNDKQWFTLHRKLARKLGVLRRLQHVVAIDEVAATHFTTSTNPAYKEAQKRACKQANIRVDDVEKEQEYILYDDPTIMERSIEIIKEEYSRAYNRAFMVHLHPRGEYNIHGHRGRHPLQNIHAQVISQSTA